MTFQTRQISDKPPRFETALTLHSYTVANAANSGWYRIEVVGMGASVLAAQINAQERLAKAMVDVLVASIELRRVPEAMGATEEE